MYILELRYTWMREWPLTQEPTMNGLLMKDEFLLSVNRYTHWNVDKSYRFCVGQSEAWPRCIIAMQQISNRMDACQMKNTLLGQNNQKWTHSHVPANEYGCVWVSRFRGVVICSASGGGAMSTVWHWGQGVNYPVGTWWVHCDFWSNSLTFYPPGPWRTLLKRTLQFAHILPSR